MCPLSLPGAVQKKVEDYSFILHVPASVALDAVRAKLSPKGHSHILPYRALPRKTPKVHKAKPEGPSKEEGLSIARISAQAALRSRKPLVEPGPAVVSGVPQAGWPI
jgi:hypothetical protein